MQTKESQWITSQNKLAKAVGLCPVTIYRAKVDKYSISKENYEKLAEVSGISVWAWSAGPREKLALRLRSFFRKQRENKILSRRAKKC